MKPILIITILLLSPFTQLNAKINCSKNTVCIETYAKSQKVIFYAINKKEHKVSIKMDVQMAGMNSSVTLPEAFVLQGKEKQFLFYLEHGKKAWRYNYHYDWAKGDYTAIHSSVIPYSLPYASPNKFKITQSCNGSFTHFGHSKYAIDFKMPINTPIHAAREGVIIDVKSNSSIGGDSKNFIDDANYVLIEHSDGTLGEYAHLKLNGIVVNVGQFVTKGELIGYSGKTGYATGPHLHFVVKSANEKGKNISIPIPFLTSNGIITCPDKNSYLFHEKQK